MNQLSGAYIDLLSLQWYQFQDLGLAVRDHFKQRKRKNRATVAPDQSRGSMYFSYKIRHLSISSSLTFSLT